MRKEASFISVATAFALLTTAVGGGMYVGALANEVENLKADQSKVEQIEKEVKKNTVALTAVSTRQGYIITEQLKQDKKLDKILEKLEDLK